MHQPNSNLASRLSNTQNDLCTFDLNSFGSKIIWLGNFIFLVLCLEFFDIQSNPWAPFFDILEFLTKKCRFFLVYVEGHARRSYFRLYTVGCKEQGRDRAVLLAVGHVRRQQGHRPAARLQPKVVVGQRRLFKLEPRLVQVGPRISEVGRGRGKRGELVREGQLLDEPTKIVLPALFAQHTHSITSQKVNNVPVIVVALLLQLLACRHVNNL